MSNKILGIYSPLEWHEMSKPSIKNHHIIIVGYVENHSNQIIKGGGGKSKN